MNKLSEELLAIASLPGVLMMMRDFTREWRLSGPAISPAAAKRGVPRDLSLWRRPCGHDHDGSGGLLDFVLFSTFVRSYTAFVCGFCSSVRDFARLGTSHPQHPASFRFHLTMDTLAFG